MKDELNFLYVDMDAFYASVEEKDNPKLKNVPLVVGSNSRRGVVTTANYKAREFGIKSAMPMFIARRLCPNVTVAPTRMKRYVELSGEIFKELNTFSKTIEMVSIDEGCLDISHLEMEPFELAKSIQKNIYDKFKITLSIGISYNKFLAKLASDWNKPNGVKIITKDMIPNVLLPLSVGKVYGVGEKTEKKLNNMSIYTIEDLYKVSYNDLYRLFGVSGHHMYNKIRGIDSRKIKIDRKRKSVSAERTLVEDLRSRESISKIIKKLSKVVEEDLKKEKYLGRTISIKLKDIEFQSITKSFTIQEPTQSFDIIYSIALNLFKEVYIEKNIRLVGVGVSNLSDRSYIQLNFFDRDNYNWKNLR